MTIVFYQNPNSRCVSVYSNGIIQISSRAVRDFGLGDWKQVILGYDSESKQVIIKQCKKDEFGGLYFKSHGANPTAASISAKRFFDFFNLSIEKLCGKKYEIQQEDDTLIFSIMGD